jgi:hypothetical protein
LQQESNVDAAVRVPVLPDVYRTMLPAILEMHPVETRLATLRFLLQVILCTLLGVVHLA